MNKLLAASLLVVVAFVGMGCSFASTEDKISVQKPKQSSERLEGLTIRGEGISGVQLNKDSVQVASTQPGKISLSLDGVKSNIQNQGSFDGTSEYDGARIMSWYGLSPNQVAAMRQGLQYADGQSETEFWGGQSKGYGLFERLIDWLKSAFWFLVSALIVGGLVIGILYVMPQTRFIAQWIIKWFMSLIPVVGTWYRGLISKQEVDVMKRPLVDTIKGLENAKRELISSSTLTGGEAWDIVSRNLSISQDNESKQTISAFRSPKS